ncbi:TPA: pyruvate, phosphate dikinase [Clostridioides difficile]|uniref:PEP/pyruvate-binding domain-containing protein n=1 Tax=Clostridioides difficile TaxID=1496 RepID=UPI00093CF113|nr:PEP/pyruvate-binding domain-containing protein [Clostridioides difficile]EJA6612596.1 pyruvate, phosphate dikinase [Clostridioides difficile]MBY2473499.1 pyruvate, phosphate dikinase [Clostridioides difficile]MBY2813525.1 pyruvate, phosphate dikinase [Clostridioides difficile]MBZ0515027.1 pyruvate, phosphate dikinase [Clostridioides difficile]MDE3438283.1 PEP/pyruvate-binding domain-containing protein [Clostridioides difficile]
MIYYVLPLEHKQATIEIVGGKGMSLSKLLTAGIPVPDGFHVTTASYQIFVETNHIQSRINKLLDGIDSNNTSQLEDVSKKIGELFHNGEMPQEVSDAIKTAYAGLGNISVAVRSSATAEDLPDASFAGQQETYLNIQGEDKVIDAVKRCWASLWTARAIAYRVKNNIKHEIVALAVVVQKLAFSDSSGIMFTLNPINGRRSEMIINAAWGLGEAVVSSLVTPDTIVVDKDSERIISYEVANKEIMTVRTSEGTEETMVPERLRKKYALTRNQVMQLIQLGKKIEKYYQMPMDVEWALEKDKLYIVQARPITVLPPEWVLPEQDVVYTKGSLAEHLPNPVTPLFATLGLEIVNRASELLWIDMFGKSAKKLLPKNGAYTVINGYVYLSAKSKPLLIAIKSLSPRSLRRTLMNSVARWETARKGYEDAIKQWEEKPLHTMNAHQIMDGIQTIFYAACIYFTRIQLTLPAASISETLFTKLFQGAVRRAGITDTSVFLLGFDTIALQSEKELWGLSEWVKQNNSINLYLQNSPAIKIAEDFMSSVMPVGVSQEVWIEWKNRINKYFKEFGRTAYEFDFAYSTPQETLTPTFESVKTFVEGKGESPFLRQTTFEKRRKHAEEEILQHISGLRKKLFFKLLHWAQETSPMRENAIYLMGMGHPLIRCMFQEISERFIRGGAISHLDDIYWLTKSELEVLIEQLDKNKSLSDMNGIIPVRKAELKKYMGYVSPSKLPEKNKKTISQAPQKQKDGKIVLTGIGTSTGVVTAPACVLNSPADFESFQPGSVLVAVTTTPAWTPLFSSASAIVTDIGGPLSHSSIVAREYGIPAVMATHIATRTIKSGQMITVDGLAGTVTFDE